MTAVREPAAAAASERPVGGRSSGSGPSRASAGSRADPPGGTSRSRPKRRASSYQSRVPSVKPMRTWTCVGARSPRRGTQPAAAHAEVGQEREAAVEPDQQVLAGAPEAADGAAAQPPRQVRRDGLAQPQPREPDRADRAAAHVLRQQAANGLDLGQLGHGGTLVRPLRARQGGRAGTLRWPPRREVATAASRRAQITGRSPRGP